MDDKQQGDGAWTLELPGGVRLSVAEDSPGGTWTAIMTEPRGDNRRRTLFHVTSLTCASTGEAITGLYRAEMHRRATVPILSLKVEAIEAAT